MRVDEAILRNKSKGQENRNAASDMPPQKPEQTRRKFELNGKHNLI